MRGFSLIETIVALALTASVSACLLPALALAARLHRDSAIETESAIVASARLARLAADVGGGMVDIGGRLDAAQAGWQEFVDRSGTACAAASASFDTRWQVAMAAGAAGVYVLTVRVIPLADPAAGLTLATAVPDG